MDVNLILLVGFLGLIFLGLRSEVRSEFSRHSGEICAN